MNEMAKLYKRTSKKAHSSKISSFSSVSNLPSKAERMALEGREAIYSTT